VTIRLAERGIRLMLLDIEGTTTPIAFVHEVLFPFARVRLDAWLARHATSDVYRDVLQRLATEHAADVAAGESAPAWDARMAARAHASAVAYATWLMDRDRKSPALKLLQGLIWEEGYQAGLLHGEVFSDVPSSIRRWREAGVETAIYSSGSELAQRRLFGSTEHGDVTPLLTGFFDTRVGAKVDAASYRRIASALGRRPVEVLFLSDLTRELLAARHAGCQVALSLRPGNDPQPDAAAYEAVRSFEEIQ
jgi:enolase-phosphatase E1